MSIKKNIVSNFILTASSILFPLITLPYITRTLSAANIGRVFYIDSFTQYLGLFAALGIPVYGVREVAKVRHDKSKLSQLVLELVTIQFTLSVLACIVFFTLPFFFKALSVDFNLVKIGCILIMCNSFMIEWYYQGIEQFTYITIRSLIIRAINVLMILFLVVNNADHETYYLITALTITISGLLNFSIFLKKDFVAFKLKNSIFLHFKPLLLLFTINVSISLYTVVDTIILGSMTGPEQVSFYIIPLRIVKLFWTVMGGIGWVLIPKMSSLFLQKDTEGIQVLMKKSLNIVLLLGIPFFFLVVFFPSEILSIVSGQQYLQARLSLQILAIVPLIIGICNVFGTQYLLAIGLERKILFATIFGFIVSLSLNFALIPFLGYVGSAIACVCAELVVCLVVFYHAKKTIRIHLDHTLLYLILSSAALSIVFLLSFQHFFSSLMMLFSTAFVYVISFILLHFLVFKSAFINSLINFRTAK